MNKPRQSAMQRIQVGIVGLVVVLLFVGIANMVLERAVDTPQSAPSGGGITGTEIATETKTVPEAPLSELGVAPVLGADKTGKAKSPPQQADSDLLAR